MNAAMLDANAVPTPAQMQDMRRAIPKVRALHEAATARRCRRRPRPGGAIAERFFARNYTRKHLNHAVPRGRSVPSLDNRLASNERSCPAVLALNSHLEVYRGRVDCSFRVFKISQIFYQFVYFSRRIS
jgi:hypothetical protein